MKTVVFLLFACVVLVDGAGQVRSSSNGRDTHGVGRRDPPAPGLQPPSFQACWAQVWGKNVVYLNNLDTSSNFANPAFHNLQMGYVSSYYTQNYPTDIPLTGTPAPSAEDAQRYCDALGPSVCAGVQWFACPSFACPQYYNNGSIANPPCPANNCDLGSACPPANWFDMLTPLEFARLRPGAGQVVTPYDPRSYGYAYERVPCHGPPHGKPPAPGHPNPGAS